MQATGLARSSLGFAATSAVLACLIAAPYDAVSQEIDEFATGFEIDSDAGFECVMEPRTMAQVGSPGGGILRSILVSRGDFVTKGQIVAQLESMVQKLALEQARLRANNTVDLESRRERLRLEREKTARIQSLFDKNVVSSAAIDEAKTAQRLAEFAVQAAEMDQKAQRLALKQAEQALERRTIRSPVDGVITARMLAAGEFVYEQSPILEIAEIDPLFVETFLPIDLYQYVRGKETATVVPAPPVSGRFEAKISVVDQVFDAASGTFGVRLLLDNPDGALPAGVPCRVYFD